MSHEPHDNMGLMKASVLTLLAGMVLSAFPALMESQGSQDTLKVNVDLVNVQFAVTDRHGRFVPGLKQEDFMLEEDGKRQDILHFARENELPLTISMLIDTSPSVRPVFEEEKDTAESFLDSILKPNDLALVIGFDRSVTLVQDFTDRPRLLKSAIDDLQIGGGTSVYDAVYLACKEKLSHEAGRKTVILISDGEDTTSKTKFFEALVAAHQSDTVIYSISNSPRGFFARGGTGGGGGDPGTLRKFSDETGGATFFVDRANSFKKVFDQIAQELRSQYSLGYMSTNQNKDGKFRQIKIVPRDSNYVVRARKGYYAPKDRDR
jgi:Ca-activated chloride channel family protein